MGHRLKPSDGMPYLAPAEVIERLRDEFACVDADAEAGADHVGDMIAAFLRMKSGYANARHEQIAGPLALRAAEALNYRVEIL